ncbi:hypothetical protein ETAE_2049 [Edwardsiella piscicida]|uniref:Uncharacterized protein n=1 Tax=Edwardsiella piscicida TaxID=1263550 RepID=A0AAU8PFS6_EDWPI|nr:hypothetical protein ETAE_2049 [Edwardsiella tarda EIB202]
MVSWGVIHNRAPRKRGIHFKVNKTINKYQRIPAGLTLLKCYQRSGNVGEPA